MLEGRFSESLSLVDAVMPDVVLAKQQQLREKMAAQKLKEPEKQLSADEKLSLSNNENSVNSSANTTAVSSVVCAADVTSLTTTVVTAATSTTTIKQEPQTNGEHGTASKRFIVFAVFICARCFR